VKRKIDSRQRFAGKHEGRFSQCVVFESNAGQFQSRAIVQPQMLLEPLPKLGGRVEFAGVYIAGDDGPTRSRIQGLGAPLPDK
jgi:hypothetical protein